MGKWLEKVDQWIEALDRLPPPAPVDPDTLCATYPEAWQELQKRIGFLRMVERGWFVLLLFALLPLLLAAFSIIQIPQQKSPSPLAIVFLVAVVVQLALRMIADARMNSFLCPRCGQPFLHIQSLSRSPLSEIDGNASFRPQCRNCHLPVDNW